MKTKWDYTDLADSYIDRPDYSNIAIDAFLSIADIQENDKVCDIGAGVAHLTIPLLKRGLNVTALEPNDSMRKNGIYRTENYTKVKWVEAVCENSLQEDESFDLVTFGSSFNVCDRNIALKESYRILKPGGWFVCLWNHRDLSAPIQSNIEKIIKKHVPEYLYGTRREDQTEVIEKSGLFDAPVFLKSRVTHKVSVNSFINAWKSHATLKRQSAEIFSNIILEISKLLISQGEYVDVVYETVVWVCKSKKNSNESF